MKKEYRIAKGWKIFVWICMPLLMALFGWLGIMPYTDKEFDLTLALIFTPISLGFEFLMIIGLLDMIKSKLIIENEKIINVGVFKIKELSFDSIKGIKVDQNYLHFLPKNKSDKKIKVSSYVGRFWELRDWAERKFTDLDVEEFVNDEKELLKNEEFGRTQEEREYRIKKAKQITKTINTISWIVALSAIFYPHFYKTQIVLCALLPIVGLFISFTSKGLIRLEGKSNSAYPDILISFFIPSCALMVRALLDFAIFDYSNFVKPALAIFVLLSILLFKGAKVEYNFKKGVTYLAIFGIFMLTGMYTYGLLISTNALFDNSKPTVYKAKILNKRISSGKTTTYYLELDKWGLQKEVDDVSVTKDIYYNHEIGDTAVVYFRHGLYKIPHYFVTQ